MVDKAVRFVINAVPIIIVTVPLIILSQVHIRILSRFIQCLHYKASGGFIITVRCRHILAVIFSRVIGCIPAGNLPIHGIASAGLLFIVLLHGYEVLA
ncbi:Uncharacterised protein [Mycobacteroides abscessus subsp. abscessus]|nr:Uncharacterised protein [Mycobacteroides abscessus subsp. abscessus]